MQSTYLATAFLATLVVAAPVPNAYRLGYPGPESSEGGDSFSGGSLFRNGHTTSGGNDGGLESARGILKLGGGGASEILSSARHGGNGKSQAGGEGAEGGFSGLSIDLGGSKGN